MNSWILTGQIISSPQQRYTNDGQTIIAETKIAYHDGQNDQPETVKVIAFGKTAERLMNCQLKEKVCLEGQLKVDLQEKNNAKYNVWQIVLDRFNSLDHPSQTNRSSTNAIANSSRQHTPPIAPAPVSAPANKDYDQVQGWEGDTMIDIDNMPF